MRSLRTLELRKAPSVSETLDWARTLVVLGIESIDAAEARDTLHILLKYQTDIERAAKELLVRRAPEPGETASPCSTCCRGSSPSCARPACRSR